jgi:hypothetical protein
VSTDTASDTVPVPARSAGGRWTTRRAVILSGVIVVWVPGCAVATWWQVNIALSGDKLGWVYTFMWPLFALFAVVLWWNLIHDDPDTVGARGLRRLQEQAALVAAQTESGDSRPEGGQAEADAIGQAEEHDAELAAYNAYLAALAADPEAKTWKRR